ncbi:cyclic-guanylate-specific phosphodiesterase [Pluralibacter gergoviae]|uniref:cyclic-guanylate-specific phosphodiesterase n=1 Tax=Pluralibacter gergoviae TaxID=61647 RepID=UPI000651691F|nr:cyclic-guanylate-specific phosphodiesterase [Pluralibacter gergoviae]KMK36071.1 c-di-GMP phosphodiesterase [Pluralibacter gergoviae]
MKLSQIIRQINVPDGGFESLQERRYWLECERAYTWQPIYRTCGRLMAIELLTVVTHPAHPGKYIAPDRYFSEVAVRQRLDVVKEQLAMLFEHRSLFIRNEILVSVNVDGPTLLVMRQDPSLMALIDDSPWLRFELVEHARLPDDAPVTSLSEFGPLWLDDFGTGLANFSALGEVKYDFIKLARELFIMLRQSPEGHTLFGQLILLMNRYCRGVIVEGVETEEEWRAVQDSPAFAAQGYFLSRPAPISRLSEVALNLS